MEFFTDIIDIHGKTYVNKVMKDELLVQNGKQYTRIGGSINVTRNEYGSFSVTFQSGNEGLCIHPVWMRKASPEDIGMKLIENGYEVEPDMEYEAGCYVQGMACNICNHSYY